MGNNEYLKKGNSFYHFAKKLEQLANTRRIEEKLQILQEEVQSRDNEQIFHQFLLFLSGEYVLSLNNERISIGSQLIGRSASEYLNIDYELVFKPCKEVMGKTPESISKLFENIDIDSSDLTFENYTLSQIQNLLVQFSNCKKSKEKLDLLNVVWRTMHPVEIRYFLQLLSGKLSVGCSEDLLLSAIASTYNLDLADVHAMYRHNYSIVETGLLAKTGNIEGVLPENKVISKIHTVLLYVQSESNGNLGKYSELTVGVRVDEKENFGQDFVPIGKITSELAEQDLYELKNRLPDLVLDKFGPTYMLRPEIVIEIEFHQIVSNKRTKAGYSIKSTRVIAFHWEKTLHEVQSLTQIIDIHNKNGR